MKVLKISAGYTKLMISGLGLLVAVSCSVTQQYRQPAFNNKDLYRGNNAVDTVSLATLSWKELFSDKRLQDLIAEGINNNLDLKNALSRIRQAKAYLDQSKLQFYPSIDANAAASFNQYSDANNLQGINRQRQYQYNIQASWEADIWGKLKSAKRSNLAAMLQQDAIARAVQTSLVASIATDYYNLLAMDMQLAITKQSVDNWQATVNVMSKLKTADVVTGAAVVQSEASKYAVSATIPDLERAIWQTENHLNLLLARQPGPIVRDSLPNQQMTSRLATGLPVQLLANRPDVQAAEYNFRYCYEQTNVARTFFYPALTLSASTGYTSYTSLFSLGSWVNNVVGGLTQPIFNKGINKTRLIVAKEQQLQAANQFQQVLLVAGQEVSDALFSYSSAGNKTAIRENQLFNLQKSVNFTLQLVRYGSANYTEVLTAQQNLLIAQLDQINDHLQQLQAVVSLYRALGGGWK